MTYHSVAEIYAATDDAHARLVDSIAHLSAGDEQLRFAPEQWSIAEIVEHVAIVEGHIAKLAGMMLHQAASAGAPPAPHRDGRITPISIEEEIAQSLREKYEAPATARPRGGVAIADSLARIERAREIFSELRPRIEAIDGASVSYPHPIFGPFNLYQWLVMVGVHKDRHRRQIEAVKETTKAED